MREVGSRQMVGDIMRDKRRWGLVMPLTCLLLVVSSISPVAAFTVVEHAMCKEVTLSTTATEPATVASVACVQRTSEFLLTDGLAYLWIRGTTEKSDVGAELDLRFYDPDGHVFWSFSTYSAPRPEGFSPVRVLKEGGEIAIWMGISILKANMLNVSLGVVDFSGETVEATATCYPGGSPCRFRYGPGGFSTSMISDRQGKGASERPGDWRAEFTVGGMPMVVERFSVGKTVTATPTTVTTRIGVGTETQSIALRLPIDVLLIAVVVAVVVSALVGTLLRRRRKMPTPSAVEARPCRVWRVVGQSVHKAFELRGLSAV